jgi:hypothetical protein
MAASLGLSGLVDPLDMVGMVDVVAPLDMVGKGGQATICRRK